MVLVFRERFAKKSKKGQILRLRVVTRPLNLNIEDHSATDSADIELNPLIDILVPPHRCSSEPILQPTGECF